MNFSEADALEEHKKVRGVFQKTKPLISFLNRHNQSLTLDTTAQSRFVYFQKENPESISELINYNKLHEALPYSNFRRYVMRVAAAFMDHSWISMVRSSDDEMGNTCD